MEQAITNFFGVPAATWLPVVWAGLIGVAVLMYVVLDGFDLGLGVLFPFTPHESERDQMMASVAPFWDGNETWLILGGAGLFVAFPLAYSIIMPAFYGPVILMLLALVFRGVAFEFRWVSKPNHRAWDVAFAAGSTLAAFSQGLILGGLLEGVAVRDSAFAGGAFDWLSPFSILCGVGVVAGYALLAACWLLFKTEGPLVDRARAQGRVLLFVLLAFVAVVSLWTPFAHPRIAERWFNWSHIVWLWPFPALTAAAGWLVWRGFRHEHDLTPFLGTLAIFTLCFAGLAISNFPYLVPPGLTVWQAAAVPEAQLFLLVGVVFLLPLILAYTAFVYWTFRGRVTADSHYHSH